MVTQGLSNTVSYTDDVVTFSGIWQEHIGQIRELFEALKRARLGINLAREAKVQAIVDADSQRTRPMHSHTANATFGDVSFLLPLCAHFCSSYGPFDKPVEDECEVDLV